MNDLVNDLVAVIPEREGVIVNLAAARRALAEARRIEDVKLVRDQAAAVEQYARERRLGMHAVLDASEVKVYAERRGGELLREMPKQDGGDAARTRFHGGTESPPSLSSLGITKQDSHRWQRIAGIPEGAFEAYIAAAREQYLEPGNNKPGITTAALLRIADPPEKKARRWNLLTESEAIEAWLGRRAMAWPEEARPRFAEFVRGILDRMERDTHASRGQGHDSPDAGAG